jgi:SAM-dependent methyltransferase
MDHAEMVALIRGGVPAADRAWAELGAGTGNFTWALRDLLHADATIYAVDRDAHALAVQRTRAAHALSGAIVLPIQADVTRPLALPPLDGVLLANALHVVRAQAVVIAQVAGYLRTGGRVLLVEYDLHHAQRWVPFPVPLPRFHELAASTGLAEPALIGSRRSPSTGRVRYAVLARKVRT